MKTLLLSAIATATLALSINAASAVDINGDNAAYRAADLSVIQSTPVEGRSFFSAPAFNGDINGDTATYRAADLSVIQSKPVAGRSFFSAPAFNGDINGDGATYRAADLEIARSGSLLAR
jgi:hypothetical protein